jgi:serine protease
MARRAFFILPLLILAAAGSAPGATIDPELLQTLSAKGPGAQAPALMLFDAPVDLGALDASLQGVPWRERQLRVIEVLQAHAAATQAEAMAILRQAESAGRVSQLRSLWTVNGIAFRATADAIQSVAQAKAPADIVYDKRYDMISAVTAAHPTPAQAADRSAPGARVQPLVPVTAWSISWIRADQVWPLGYTGAGVLVAGMDTGVWLTHPDIAGQIFTNPGEIPGDGIDNDSNGYIDDVHGYDFGDRDSDPNDDVTGGGSNHGTHTAGTVAGNGTNGTSTGVAPGCRFLPCKVFPSAGGGAALSDIWEAHGYAIRMGARVFTESLGVTGILPPSLMRSARVDADAIRVAGVAYFNSAGNDGGTSNLPPDQLGLTARVPSAWNANAAVPWSSRGGVNAVGGTGYKSDAAYAGSSMGPSSWALVAPWNDWPLPDGLTKPDVCAPGVLVNSLQKPNGYSGDSWTGTSMSCPHTAGTAALMLQKNPALTPVDIDRILEQTCVDLGVAGKDNQFGAGRIDALAAVNAVPAAQLPYVVQTALGFHEPGGNGYIDPGETIDVIIQLTNNSAVINATAVTGALSVAANPYVTVIDGASGYPNLAAGGGSADNSADVFTVSVAPGTPQGFLMTLLLTITTAEGYTVTIDSQLQVGLTDFLTHDVGAVYGTVTDSGILGYTDSDHGFGEGFGPTGEASALYVGSLWGGQNAGYVCNHDYPGTGVTLETAEWRTVTNPNGRVLKVTPPRSNQDFRSLFDDSGALTPKSLQITQESYAFSTPGYDKFIILTYRVKNLAATTLTTYHAGVFCDWDIADGNNLGGVDTARRMTYMNAGPGVADGPFYGIQLIFPAAYRNLALINNATFVYPDGRINDTNKARLLRGLITNTVASSLIDWSALTSTGPYDIPAGAELEFTFALVYGTTLADLLANADAAQNRYAWLQAADASERPQPLPAALFQNAPNPFNPATTIRFAVQREGPVSLAVYDLAGRKVRILEERTFTAGQWSVRWDGTNDRGEPMPSGMYFYRLEADGKRLARKMMMVK